MQQVFSGMFVLFATAKSISSFEKVSQDMTLRIYQTKAKLNEENFQILNLIETQASFKVIFFQIDKDLKRNQVNKYEGVTKSIQKVLAQAENKKADMKKDDDA